MLTCVYHPIDNMRVVESEEAERLLELAVWFDCPTKAAKYRSKVEQDIKREKAKQKEKSNERK